MKVIQILVSPTGQTKIETIGFVGRECQHASLFLIGALGEKSTEQLKPEFHDNVEYAKKIEHHS